jgi:hypothetical protein
VAGTTAAPISCSNVDIYVSVDGGYTYPFLAKGRTANDGSETITLPNPLNSPGARVKVKGSGNVFFNISNGFTLNHGTVGVTPAPAADAIRVFPVPARDALHIRIPAALSSMEARFVNQLGQLVWEGALSGESTLPVSGWAPGIYHLQMHNMQGVHLSRTVVVE